MKYEREPFFCISPHSYTTYKVRAIFEVNLKEHYSSKAFLQLTSGRSVFALNTSENFLTMVAS